MHSAFSAVFVLCRCAAAPRRSNRPRKFDQRGRQARSHVCSASSCSTFHSRIRRWWSPCEWRALPPCATAQARWRAGGGLRGGLRERASAVALRALRLCLCGVVAVDRGSVATSRRGRARRVHGRRGRAWRARARVADAGARGGRGCAWRAQARARNGGRGRAWRAPPAHAALRRATRAARAARRAARCTSSRAARSAAPHSAACGVVTRTGARRALCKCTAAWRAPRDVATEPAAVYSNHTTQAKVQRAQRHSRCALPQAATEPAAGAPARLRGCARWKSSQLTRAPPAPAATVKCRATGSAAHMRTSLAPALIEFARMLAPGRCSSTERTENTAEKALCMLASRIFVRWRERRFASSSLPNEAHSCIPDLRTKVVLENDDERPD